MFVHRHAHFAFAAALYATLGSPAFAVDYTWNNQNGTVWNSAANWLPNTGVPKEATDKAVINGAPTGTAITLNDIDIALDTFSINSKNTFIQFVDKKVTVNGSAAFVNARVLLNNMTWEGTGTLTNSIPLPDGFLIIRGNTTISAPFVTTGAMEVVGSNTGNAPIDTNLKIGSFENKGRLRLTSSMGIGDASITLNNGSGTLTNSNLMEVEAGAGGARSIEGALVNAKGATLTVGTTFTVVGDANSNHVNNGLINITNKTAVFTVFGKTFTNAAGATIKGAGKFDRSNIPGANFSNKGNLQPGYSPGILEIEGDYLEESTAQLDIEIGGSIVESQYDQLIINGAATLSGMLSVTLIDGFLPSASDTFIVLDAKNGISGSYFNAPSDGSLLAIDGGIFQVHYVSGPGTQEMVVLSNFLAVPIPEPATLAIFGFSSLLLLARRHTRQGPLK